MVASSAEEAIRSNEEKSSPWIMEKVQSNDDVLDPAPTEAEEAEEVVEAAAATAAAAATPAPDVGTDEAPWPSTSVVWTQRTSRMLEIGTKRTEENRFRLRYRYRCRSLYFDWIDKFDQMIGIAFLIWRFVSS